MKFVYFHNNNFIKIFQLAHLSEELCQTALSRSLTQCTFVTVRILRIRHGEHGPSC